MRTAAAEAFARHKELHLHTAQACEQQGVKFGPFVAECTGTWDPSALEVLRHVAHAAAAKTGEKPPVFAGTWHHDSVLSGPHCAAAPMRSFLSVAPSLALQWASFQVQVATVEDRIWLDAAHMDPHGCQQ